MKKYFKYKQGDMYWWLTHGLYILLGGLVLLIIIGAATGKLDALLGWIQLS